MFQSAVVFSRRPPAAGVRESHNLSFLRDGALGILLVRVSPKMHGLCYAVQKAEVITNLMPCVACCRLYHAMCYTGCLLNLSPPEESTTQRAFLLAALPWNQQLCCRAGR